MVNSVTIEAGTLVMRTAAGLGQEAVAEVANGGIAGIAAESKTSGTGGADFIQCLEGTFLFDAASIVQGSVGDVMFAVDDRTFDETDTGNLPRLGFLEELVSATSGWIRVGLGLHA